MKKDVHSSGKQCLWVPTHDGLVGGSIPQTPVERMINHAAAHLAALNGGTSVLQLSCDETIKERGTPMSKRHSSLFGFSVNELASLWYMFLALAILRDPTADPH